jgi:hypothetical protein
MKDHGEGPCSEWMKTRGSHRAKSRPARGTAGLISVSPLSAGYNILTYLHIDMSEFNHANNPSPRNDRLGLTQFRNHPTAKKANWNTYYEYMAKYQLFRLSLARHEGDRYGRDVMATEEENGNNDNWLGLAIVDKSSEVHLDILLNI